MARNVYFSKESDNIVKHRIRCAGAGCTKTMPVRVERAMIKDDGGVVGMTRYCPLCQKRMRSTRDPFFSYGSPTNLEDRTPADYGCKTLTAEERAQVAHLYTPPMRTDDMKDKRVQDREYHATVTYGRFGG